jgi:hypothetical protein
MPVPQSIARHRCALLCCALEYFTVLCVLPCFVQIAYNKGCINPDTVKVSVSFLSYWKAVMHEESFIPFLFLLC